jgi:flavin-dependent thymidylate synthase
LNEQIKVELLETMGSDTAIAHSAWTSSLEISKKELRTEADTTRVVNMLADLKHSVPFESVIFRFWMRIPISTDRQVMTHRIASHSGMSGRYRTMPNDFLEMPDDAKAILNKLTGNTYYLKLYQEICEDANLGYRQVLQDLKEAEKSGTITNSEYKRVREVYRNILPQGNMTERVTVMNLRSFANFYKLRSKSDAQPEIQDLANQMMVAVKASGICPVALDALERNGWSI